MLHSLDSKTTRNHSRNLTLKIGQCSSLNRNREWKLRG